MAKYFVKPFGVNGDKTAIPDAAQVSGSVSYDSGWGADYQKNLATDPTAKPFSRRQQNELEYDITLAIQYLQQFGVPAFITTSDNLGVAFAYSKYAIVRYDDGVNGFRLYQSRIDNNSTLPTNTTNWKWLDPDAESIPAGTMLDFGGTSVPAGFLGCDGSAVSRTTYAGLFAAIGTTWGVGDGSTTFNLPDFRRRVAVGSGGSAGVTLGNTVGSTGGSEDAVVVTHTHTGTVTHQVIAVDAPVGATNIIVPGVGTDFNLTIQPPVSGVSGAGENVQPSAVVLKIIKT